MVQWAGGLLVSGVASNKFLLDGSTGLRRDLQRRTVKDLIADKLAALIASGVMVIGDELPSERELAAALSVSRETVRGAVQTLAARGILEVTQGARTRVAKADFSDMAVGIANRLNVDSYDVEAVHAARLLIEQSVVGDAAEHFSGEALKRLDSSIEAQRASMNDPVRFLICDREFHVTIYRECGNPLLADMVTDLYTYMMEHRRRVMAQPGAIANSFADHVVIVDALRKRDRAAAMAAFGAHEERIYTSTRSLLAQSGTGRR
jgi:DNA-binding FadR family transcriptional regulator